MKRFLRLAAITGLIAAGVRVVMVWRRGRLAGEAPFNGLRLAMNDRVNPWLMGRGMAGGAHSEIATLEHVGRKTGEVHRTPVAPTFVEDQVWIPLPYGEASQWAKNVIAAGHCRLQLHGTVYDLDEPQIVAATEDPKLPAPMARTLGWLGIEYLRLHRFAERAGALEEALEPIPATEEVQPETVQAS